VSEKGKALAEINDHVAVERNHQAMNEMRMEFAAFKDQVAAKARANDQAVRELRVELAGIKYQIAANFGEEDRDMTEMRAELIELKDLIYANSENNQAITETNLRITVLKTLIYANFGEEDQAITKIREELAETKAWEQDTRIFAKSMENEQAIMDTRMDLWGIGDRVLAPEDRALEHDGRVFRGEGESEMRDREMARLREMGRLREMDFLQGKEVCRLGVEVAGLDEEIRVQNKGLEMLSTKLARRERIVGRLREEGFFD